MALLKFEGSVVQPPTHVGLRGVLLTTAGSLPHRLQLRLQNARLCPLPRAEKIFNGVHPPVRKMCCAEVDLR